MNADILFKRLKEITDKDISVIFGSNSFFPDRITIFYRHKFKGQQSYTIYIKGPLSNALAEAYHFIENRRLSDV